MWPTCCDSWSVPRWCWSWRSNSVGRPETVRLVEHDPYHGLVSHFPGPFTGTRMTVVEPAVYVASIMKTIPCPLFASPFLPSSAPSMICQHLQAMRGNARVPMISCSLGMRYSYCQHSTRSSTSRRYSASSRRT